MNDLTIQIIAGLVVAAIGAVVGFYFKQFYGSSEGVLPGRYRAKEKIDYSRLNGTWHLYYVTQYPYLLPTPLWVHGIQEIEVNGHIVHGRTLVPDHPDTQTSYHLHGEIRGGKMLLADYCLQDETEFATMIFHDLRKHDLIGIWTGLDGFNHLFAAPVVLSRVERSPLQLNEILKQSLFSLLPVREPIFDVFFEGKVVNHHRGAE